MDFKRVKHIETSIRPSTRYGFSLTRLPFYYNFTPYYTHLSIAFNSKPKSKVALLRLHFNIFSFLWCGCCVMGERVILINKHVVSLRLVVVINSHLDDGLYYIKIFRRARERIIAIVVVWLFNEIVNMRSLCTHSQHAMSWCSCYEHNYGPSPHTKPKKINQPSWLTMTL